MGEDEFRSLYVPEGMFLEGKIMMRSLVKTFPFFHLREDRFKQPGPVKAPEEFPGPAGVQTHQELGANPLPSRVKNSVLVPPDHRQSLFFYPQPQSRGQAERREHPQRVLKQGCLDRKSTRLNSSHGY